MCSKISPTWAGVSDMVLCFWRYTAFFCTRSIVTRASLGSLSAASIITRYRDRKLLLSGPATSSISPTQGAPSSLASSSAVNCGKPLMPMAASPPHFFV